MFNVDKLLIFQSSIFGWPLMKSDFIPSICCKYSYASAHSPRLINQYLKFPQSHILFLQAGKPLIRLGGWAG